MFGGLFSFGLSFIGGYLPILAFAISQQFSLVSPSTNIIIMTHTYYVLVTLLPFLSSMIAAGVGYFIFAYFTDRYNIYYVYKPAPFNGRQFLHRSAINFVIVGAALLQLLTLFFSVIRLGKKK